MKKLMNNFERIFVILLKSIEVIFDLIQGILKWYMTIADVPFLISIFCRLLAFLYQIPVVFFVKLFTEFL